MKYNFEQMNISNIISACLKCKTKERANELIEQYEKYCDTPEIARGNLGYMFGYCNSEDRNKLYKLFPVNHPVFGSGFGRDKDICSKEAFEMGKNLKI